MDNSDSYDFVLANAALMVLSHRVSPWVASYMISVTSMESPRVLRRIIMSFLNKAPAEYLSLVRSVLDSADVEAGVENGLTQDSPGAEAPSLNATHLLAMDIFAHWLVLVMLLDGVWWIGDIGQWELSQVLSLMKTQNVLGWSVDTRETWWPESMYLVKRELNSNVLHGTVQGTVNSTYPHVRQFWGIPFAQSPVGNLRWLPPHSLPDNATLNHINATAPPPACPQSTSASNVFAKYEPEIMIVGGTSEDCLTLSIWAPNNGRDLSDLPVIIWLFGGEWRIGGTDVPAWNPSSWVERSQEHIVVAVQYRVNVFGFPASRALQDQNLGILDQRAGIEWVQKNIAQFGGNPERMILWGESAGAGSADILNFAYPDEPIVQGFAADSGSVFLTLNTRSTDTAGTNFSTVASYFDCSGSAQHELDCLRQVPASEITAYLATSNGSSLTFAPFIDNEVVFGNYTERYLQNRLSNKPVLFGSNLDEGTLWYNASNTAAAQDMTLSYFQCPVPYSVAHRQSLGLTTYRYQYRGNFTNISPEVGLGAYHTSELPLLFGTSGIYGPDSHFEKAVSVKMQDLWVAFAKDPEDGLVHQGWPKAASTDGKVMILADSDSNTVSTVMAERAIDDACRGYYSSY
ncbi:Alpha/Beta hydrolase protein [Aspergillus minisclerotigenes]|uniref:Carboxylic ester hydrolase n=1 Tax=Aspergillus minisclerotigenes TaxID=656917 RepID=A0A5N6JAP0_9EURO|nr:Alpha/Beta hydrolase protein [Aspergillus minisclerotigenes]